MSIETTVDGEDLPASARLRPPVPGAVIVFSVREPLHTAIAISGGALELGRGGVPGVRLDDARLSRRHLSIRHERGRFAVCDLGSRNGTSLDGRPLTGESTAEAGALVRAGDTLLRLTHDVGPHQTSPIEVAPGRIVGPTLRRAWDAIAHVARSGDSLHIRGESGAGKEHAASVFHAASRRSGGPLVAVNCSTIPEGLAERLLFGAKKGAFSGAHADAKGYLEAAHGGTLFLDEVGDLDLNVQAKLLRVIETGEVFPLGSNRPVRVELGIVSATHKSLRALVADKRFREDLFFRLGRPEVALPPLRERWEEIPWHAEAAVHAVDARLGLHASLIERLLLLAWPGNVRELVAELREAARAALAEGAASVTASHLPSGAGTAIVAAPATTPGDDDDEPRTLPAREAILEALAASAGQVATAARRLKVHRNQLRRWLERSGIDPRSLARQGEEAAGKP